MEFHTSAIQAPKDAVPCLAEIVLGSDGPRHSSLVEVGVDASSHDRADQGIRVKKIYWRARVGINNNALVISALDNPPNPVLDGRPSDKSQVKPEHDHDCSTWRGKLAHIFHNDHKEPQTSEVKSYPAVIDGKPLAAITVPLSNLDTKNYVVDTKSAHTYLLFPIKSDSPEGQATLRFEFDNWLSAKADVEILGTDIQRALNPDAPRYSSVTPPSGAGTPLSQHATRLGRDNDGSTHPSGDAPYKEGWQKSWQ